MVHICQHRKCTSSSTAKSKLKSSSNPINHESTRLYIYHKPLRKNSWLTSACSCYSRSIASAEVPSLQNPGYYPPQTQSTLCSCYSSSIRSAQVQALQNQLISSSNHCITTAGSPRPMLPSQQQG